MSERITAAILTLAHVSLEGPADSEHEKVYSHDRIVEEFEEWLGYIERGEYE